MDEIDKKIAFMLSRGIAITETPYDEIAEFAGFTLDELFTRISAMRASKKLRRLGATLYHHSTGYTANAMVAWNVSAEKLDELAPIFANSRGVSHCYERPPLPDFPYNMYTMVHATTDAEAEVLIAEIEKATGIVEHTTLKSLKELKKTSMVYFHEYGNN